jgi:hypothetical protein
MAEILGIGTTDMPFIRMNGSLSGLLRSALAGDLLQGPMKDPANWPEPMRKEWGADEGLAAGEEAKLKQEPHFRKIKQALDDFKPDFIVDWSKDHMESLKSYALPQYWIQAHEETQYKPFAGMANFGLENRFGEDPERVVTLKGHQAGALHLVRGLQDEGFDPTYSTEQLHPGGLTHTFAGVAVHLDWDKREFETPFVPFPIDPFGPRARRAEGLGPMEPGNPLPLSPKRAFALGRAVARVLKASPWRVALVAGTGWSHTQNTSWEKNWVHPHMEGDRKRYDEWASNRFDTWDNFTYEDLEEYGQWEHLCWIVLAGAMTELGAKVEYSDFQENWCFNSNWVNTIFSVA